ncbi:DEAD-box ATP-dependent RNA helicase, mitochondrial [Trypanosoma equiperdum]|uniref:Probable eukaryotic initiation factor 4A n=1 Tax=Trypanosoma equiperdum TaxID=5694 RepID=A0A1G4IGE3_TRYEQ|nr:DEAD-box ATP-dependent RNA helicase, mitochondrial [Trypanosoma equiperdum]
MRALRCVRRGVYRQSVRLCYFMSLECSLRPITGASARLLCRFTAPTWPRKNEVEEGDVGTTESTSQDVRSIFRSNIETHSEVSLESSASPALPPKTAALDVSVLDSKGNAVPVNPVKLFSDLDNLPDWLSKGLQSSGFSCTTPIQSYTIPVLDEGHDMIGLAPTGSGKTVAFAVPALKKFQWSPNGSPRIVVLAPTRELVQQTAKVFHQLSSGKVRVCEAYGGAPREAQARRLHNGCDVLVACPGRLKDFLQNGDVIFDEVSFLVFDEADRLLDMGFKVQLDDILGYFSSHRPAQTMMWSATWPPVVEQLAQEYLSQNRYVIRSGTAGTGLQVNENIKQHIFFADAPEERVKTLVSLIKEGKIDENTAKMMIFVERQTDTENAAYALARMLGIHSRCIGVVHGGMQQRQRDHIMGIFKEGRIRILVATDVASRGLDFPDVTCVVNLIAPKNIDSYCHRIGRTGRAGRTGESFTFIGRSDGSLARDLINYLEKCGMDVPQRLVEFAEEHAQGEEIKRMKRPWRGRQQREGRSQSRGGREPAPRDSGW